MSNGFFLVSRKLTNAHHELHPMATGETACRAFAWIDMIGMANWREEGGLARGELRGSVRFLSGRWNWSPAKVSRFLRELETRKRIKRKQQSRTEPSVISICNYNDYQNQFFANSSNGETPVGANVKDQCSLTRKTNEHKDERTIQNTEVLHMGDERFPPAGDLTKDGGNLSYPDEFEEAWKSYPDRRGGNPKKAAYRAWRARVKQGASPVSLYAGLMRYRGYVESKGWVGTEYVKQASTFFGPDDWWQEDWDTPDEGNGTRTHLTAQQVAERYGDD